AGCAARPRGRSSAGCWRRWRCPARAAARGAAQGAAEGAGGAVGTPRPAPAGFSRSLRTRCSCPYCSPGGAAVCCGSGFCRSAWTFWGFLRPVSRWTLPPCWGCP
ncbi:hypothetical protein N310_03359, partial [Acanthisitta chloris]